MRCSGAGTQERSAAAWVGLLLGRRLEGAAATQVVPPRTKPFMCEQVLNKNIEQDIVSAENDVDKDCDVGRFRAEASKGYLLRCHTRRCWRRRACGSLAGAGPRRTCCEDGRLRAGAALPWAGAEPPRRSKDYELCDGCHVGSSESDWLPVAATRRTWTRSSSWALWYELDKGCHVGSSGSGWLKMHYVCVLMMLMMHCSDAAAARSRAFGRLLQRGNDLRRRERGPG